MLTRPDLEEFYQHLNNTRQLDRPLYHLLDLFDKWREVPVDKLPQFHKPKFKPNGSDPGGSNNQTATT